MAARVALTHRGRCDNSIKPDLPNAISADGIQELDGLLSELRTRRNKKAGFVVARIV